MGLLDTMDDPQFRLGMGLLAAGSARSDGAGFGQRINEVLGGMDSWKQQQAAQKRAALQEQYINAQLQEMAQKTAIEKAALEAAQRKRDALPNLFQSGTTGGTTSFNQPYGFDMISQGAKVEVPATAGPSRLDVQAALKAGYTPEEIQKLDALRNVGLDKVARTVKGIGPDGKEYEYQVDEFGRKKGDGFAQYRAPIEVNTGAEKLLLDPYNRSPLSTFKMEQTPDSKASNAVAWANNNLASQRLAFDKAGGADAVKPQFSAELGGFVFKPDAANPQGKFVPIAGAPVDGKPLTDSQSKALLFGSRMAEAEKAITELSKVGVDRPGLIYRAADTVGLGKVANFTQSENQQRVEQAKDDFLNAVLRRESGAVIGADEKENANKQYFPQVGDSDAVKEQKARNRQLAISGVLAEVPASKRNSLTPKQEPTADVGSFSDPAKESRYQAWKRSQGQ